MGKRIYKDFSHPYSHHVEELVLEAEHDLDMLNRGGAIAGDANYLLAIRQLVASTLDRLDQIDKEYLERARNRQEKYGRPNE